MHLPFHSTSTPQWSWCSLSCLCHRLCSSPLLCLAVVYFGWRAVGPSTPTSSVHVFHASCKSRPRSAAASQDTFPTSLRSYPVAVASAQNRLWPCTFSCCMCASCQACGARSLNCFCRSVWIVTCSIACSFSEPEGFC